jgi:hypothetical protein
MIIIDPDDSLALVFGLGIKQANLPVPTED